MSNGNGPAPGPKPRDGKPDGSDIAGGWRAIAGFAVVLLVFGFLFWIIYQVVINHQIQAYCDARPFLTPFFILTFSILGLFLGGWAEANWDVPAGLPYSGLVFRAGGAVGFFLIAVVVVSTMNANVVCPQTITYRFKFAKPQDVAIEPDPRYPEEPNWYQHPRNSSIADGILLYETTRARQDTQDLWFRLRLGTDEAACPIDVRIHYSYDNFAAACKDQIANTDSVSFTLSDDLFNYASSRVQQATSRAPLEAAGGGETVAGNDLPAPTNKDCFAEISLGQPVPPPYHQTFNTRSNLQLGEHVVVHLYRGSVCLEDGKHQIIYPPKTSLLSLPSSLLGLLIPAAHAEDAEACAQNNPLESPPFESVLRKLASPDADDALVLLVGNFRTYECKIYDALLDDAVNADPNVVSRLLKVLYLAPANWSNNRLVKNDAFPDFRPSGKAKKVFDRIITNDIISDDEDVRYQARKVLTSYPAKYAREKFETINIDGLGELQRMYFAYAGLFMYFKAVISGEHFDKGEMTADIMSKVIGEYKKGIALRRYLDKSDMVDSYVLDFGLGSAVRNFEKSEKDALVPAEFKPSQQLFRHFLDDTAASTVSYPFNNQLGWATCFAYTSPLVNLTSPSGQPGLTLDDAEWFKGELVTLKGEKFVLSDTGSTPLKACPGRNYLDTEATVTTGTMVKRLLRKAEDEKTNWLFVQGGNGFGWLQEQPKAAADNKATF